MDSGGDDYVFANGEEKGQTNGNVKILSTSDTVQLKVANVLASNYNAYIITSWQRWLPDRGDFPMQDDAGLVLNLHLFM